MATITLTMCDKCHDVIQGQGYHLVAPWVDYYFCEACSTLFQEWVKGEKFTIEIPD